jgi:hypothetical protein
MTQLLHCQKSQLLLAGVLARTSLSLEVGAGLRAIVENCFFNFVESSDLSTLLLLSGRMCKALLPHKGAKTSRKLSPTFQCWGIWGVGLLAQGQKLNQGNVSLLWVYTGSIRICPSPGLLLPEIIGQYNSLVYRAADGDRSYRFKSPTIRSLATTNGKQAGAGALKVSEGGKLRPIYASEVEQIMGFSIGYTRIGITQDGRTIEISTTQSVKMLGNSVIPGDIERVLRGLRVLIEGV